jgi:predicted nucleic acid-binding protein
VRKARWCKHRELLIQVEQKSDQLLPFGSGGNLSSDAHLSALALEHGAELFSCDGDYDRFPGLRWINPLA